MFDNDINVAVHASHAAYSNMMFKDALKTGTYDLQNARDAYRVACGPLGMHKDLVHRYIKVNLPSLQLEDRANPDGMKEQWLSITTCATINRQEQSSRDGNSQKTRLSFLLCCVEHVLCRARTFALSANPKNGHSAPSGLGCLQAETGLCIPYAYASVVPIPIWPACLPVQPHSHSYLEHHVTSMHGTP